MIASTAPAAPSRWPVIDLVELIGMAWLRSPNTVLIALVSGLFMAFTAGASASGLLTDRGWGVAWALVAAGALVFLGLMDTTFNLQNGLYRHLRTSWPMRAELVINVWSIGLGAAVLVTMVGHAP